MITGGFRRGYRKKMNLLKIFRFPNFIQYFPDFSQRFPDFLLTKFFKVRKCEYCGSLNPRLDFFLRYGCLKYALEIAVFTGKNRNRFLIATNTVNLDVGSVTPMRVKIQGQRFFSHCWIWNNFMHNSKQRFISRI